MSNVNAAIREVERSCDTLCDDPNYVAELLTLVTAPDHVEPLQDMFHVVGGVRDTAEADSGDVQSL